MRRQKRRVDFGQLRRRRDGEWARVMRWVAGGSYRDAAVEQKRLALAERRMMGVGNGIEPDRVVAAKWRDYMLCALYDCGQRMSVGFRVFCESGNQCKVVLRTELVERNYSDLIATDNHLGWTKSFRVKGRT